MGTKRYNLDYLKEISGGDKDFILDMIQTFIENSPGDISTLRELASKKEWEKVRENAHRFAPGLQFLGIVSLRPLINQIEDFSLNRKNTELIPAMIEKLEKECFLVSEELKTDFNL